MGPNSYFAELALSGVSSYPTDPQINTNMRDNFKGSYDWRIS